MQVTTVANEEFLYRSVRDDGTCFSSVNGVCRVSSSAFNDRSRCPSVDRAKLRNNDPQKSLKGPEQGILVLLTQEVRQISIKGRDEVVHSTDVKHVPEDENYAHAQIEPSPEINVDKVFRRLKESLSRLAEQRDWLIKPLSIR